MSKITKFQSGRSFGSLQNKMRSLYALSKGDKTIKIKVATMDIEKYAKEFESVNGCKIEFIGRDNIYSIKILEDEK